MVRTPSSAYTVDQKRVERAINHVNDYWIPVNQKLLTKIQSDLERGTYDYHFDSLIKEIRGDISLFTYCLRELLTLLRSEGVPLPASKNPIHLMEHAGLARLRKVLDVEPEKISRHTLDEAQTPQIERFKETLVSASTAEVLSEKYDLDPSTAFSSAVLRQLGLTLIAWNYPTIYQETITSLKPGDLLDARLAKSLGFSPSLLAMKLFNQWGVSTRSCRALGLLDEDEIDEEEMILNATGQTIAKLCRIGEALARAHAPDYYPDAQSDWENARAEIEVALGERGMELVQEKFRGNSEMYISHLPHMFKPALVLDTPRELLGIDHNKKGSHNPFLQVCSRAVRESLKALYPRLDPDGVSKDALRLLVRDIIPNAAFTGGAVYTIDPGIMMLVPQIEIGSVELRRLDPVDYSVVMSNGDFVSVAYQTKDPLIAHKSAVDGTIFTGIATVFGYSQRVGVLYLEIPYDKFTKDEEQHVVHLRAFAQTLNDCLNLK